MTTSMTDNLRNLIPVYLCNDSDRLAVSEDNVLYMHMLRAKLESDLADMDMDFEDSESVPVHKSGKLSRKNRRAARRVQNKHHKQSDRAHGKKRMPSAKFVREADKQDVYHAHAKFVWHENHKGEWIPRKVKKHDKFRQERFMPSPDWDGEPDPLMPAERLERNQKIEQLKNQLDVLDWEMEDVTDKIHWCHEDLQEIEWHKNREVEARQSLKEWQDRLDTLARQYNDLTERIMNLA